MISPLIALVGAVAVTVLMGQVVLKRVYTYDIKNDSIRVLLFSKVPVYHIPVSDIEEVVRPLPKQAWFNPWYALRIGNRILGEPLLIKRKHGFVRRIILTPDDATIFVEQYTKSKDELIARQKSERSRPE